MRKSVPLHFFFFTKPSCLITEAIMIVIVMIIIMAVAIDITIIQGR